LFSSFFQAGELQEEEVKTEASLVSLQQELALAEQDVGDKRSQIRFFKASVVKNDQVSKFEFGDQTMSYPYILNTRNAETIPYSIHAQPVL